MRRRRVGDQYVETVTITLPLDKAAFLRRLLSSVRAFGTETDRQTVQYFFAPYDDWIEHIDQELKRALMQHASTHDEQEDGP